MKLNERKGGGREEEFMNLGNNFREKFMCDIEGR
jgi:hypothetical protein